MIKLIKVEIKPFKNRVARALIKYHDLSMECEVWLWRSENLFVRMPEIPLKDGKIRLLLWDTKEISDAFQKEVIAQIRDQGLHLEKALKIRNKWFAEDKEKKRPGRELDKLNKEKFHARKAENHIREVTKKDETQKVEEPKVLNAMKGFTEVPVPKDDFVVKRKPR